MLWGANGNIARAIVKAFPAYRRGMQRRAGGLGGRPHVGPAVRRSASAWARIRQQDQDRHRLLSSPLRWFLVLTLGYLVISIVAGQARDLGGRGTGGTVVLLCPVLWCAAFSRSRSFRIMGGGVLVAVTLSLLLFQVHPLRVLCSTAPAVALLWLAVRKGPKEGHAECVPHVRE